MNAHGLLMAYAESSVKPVVSDFDLFLIGSAGMKYDALVEDQVGLAKYSLTLARDVLQSHKSNSWIDCWLSASEARIAEQPPIVKSAFGCGDPTSMRIVEHAVKVTLACGAVRHGSECFNFGCPQELATSILLFGMDSLIVLGITEAKLRFGSSSAKELPKVSVSP